MTTKKTKDLKKDFVHHWCIRETMPGRAFGWVFDFDYQSLCTGRIFYEIDTATLVELLAG